jgi:hypothetical protein
VVLENLITVNAKRKGDSMMAENENDQNEEKELQRRESIFRSAEQIHLQSEDLIGNIESYIELTDGNLSLVIDDLKRLGNFLEAVIEAYPLTFTLSEVMNKLELDESTLRQLLVAVGVDLDEAVINPEETVTYHDLVALLADRAGSHEGDLLGDFLRGDSPKIVWG